MPMIETVNGARVRCEARKTFAVVADLPPHKRFDPAATGDVWKDVPARAVVLFRSNSAEAVAARVKRERRRVAETRGPLALTGIGVYHLPSGTWSVPCPERVDVRALAAR